MERFNSRRNEVYKARLSESIIVIKNYLNKDDLYKEQNALKILNNAGAPAPRLIYAKDNNLYMQYIDGDTMVDNIYKMGHEGLLLLGNSLESLYKALIDYHPGTKTILGDMNLRNFILSSKDKRVYRVDLESVQSGQTEMDIGELCAFCLSYDPAFTKEKIDFTHSILLFFIDKFKLSRKRTIEEMLLSLNKIKERRGILIPPGIISIISGWHITPLQVY